MDIRLKLESEKLVRSWMQHDSAWLRDYLVQQVEDPRINLQSIFSRHFLIKTIFQDDFADLMQQEYRFSACVNWLRKLVGTELNEQNDLQAIASALDKGADNAEGLILPAFLLHTFKSLPAKLERQTIPNYIDSFLSNTQILEGMPVLGETVINTFQTLWARELSLARPNQSVPGVDPPKVFEPACGSANDYRYLHAYGIAQHLEYKGIDLCEKNVMNARELFPNVRFELGNVFEIIAGNQTYDFSFVHDLFEHLSIEGIAAAVREICRVTRVGICANFFNMDEIPEHQIQPSEDYYWNKLSLSLIKEAFASHGFNAQVVHIETFLRQQIGCFETHNPNAYTLFLWRVSH